ncbi:hypothetical protein BDA96_04G035600 [Sorghum bicolor]|uniref:Uncharacterized protein n=1 Tax=Sorghum bicolor TaxID=4558 RepID=A0A921R360_SORBI|nr:hypothetical protein BDA96_04G035600 [Sorghum bicolor]
MSKNNELIIQELFVPNSIMDACMLMVERLTSKFHLLSNGTIDAKSLLPRRRTAASTRRLRRRAERRRGEEGGRRRRVADDCKAARVMHAWRACACLSQEIASFPVRRREVSSPLAISGKVAAAPVPILF